MMSVKISPETEERIRSLIASGRYASEADVLNAAVELLETYDRADDELRAELAIADEQIARGQTIPMDETFMERMLDAARERSRLGLPVKRAVRP